MSEVMRKTTLSCALIFIFAGMILSIAAILTPSWQVVNLQEYNSVHEHGLWLDCTRHVRDGHALLRRYTTITEPLHCVYKFDYDKYSGTFDVEDDNSPVGEVNRHKFYGWHTATLILLTLALMTGGLSICIAACGCCYASLSVVFTIVTLLTSFLSNVALGLFFFFSHRADNRFIKGIVATYEQRVGLAFFLQMGACAVHFIALGIAAVATYFAFTVKGGALDRYSIQNSSKTNMTNVGRSGLAAMNNAEAQKQLLATRSNDPAVDSVENSHLFDDGALIGYDDDTMGSASATLLSNFNRSPTATAKVLPLLNPHSSRTTASYIMSPKTHLSSVNLGPRPEVTLNTRAQSNITVFDATPHHMDAQTPLITDQISSYEREPYNYRRRIFEPLSTISISAASTIPLDTSIPTAVTTSIVKEVVERHSCSESISTFQ